MRLPTVRRRTEGIHQRTSRDGRCIVYICSIQNATGKYPLSVEESPNSLAAAERLFWREQDGQALADPERPSAGDNA
jgi:hypothetical protein